MSAFYYISEEDGCAKFYLRFLGSVEVNYHKGDEVLCQAINKVNINTMYLAGQISGFSRGQLE